MPTVKIRVIGRVQGVFFRKYTKMKAQDLGLTGYVYNESDGSVIIQASGSEEQLNALEQWCHVGSPMSAVREVELTKLDEVIDSKGFEIRH